MNVVHDRKGKVVAVFAHYTDAAIYVEANVRHGYERTDEPGLDELLLKMLEQAHVGANIRRELRN